MVSPYMDRLSGGVPSSVIQLASQLAEMPSVSVLLFSQSNSKNSELVESSSELLKYEVIENKENSTALFYQKMQKNILEYRPNIIHIHGLWLASVHCAYKLAKKYNIPIVSQPHGMLMQAAMESKRFKKSLALFLYQKRDLKSARRIIASSDLEYESLKRYGLGKKVVVISNGVEKRHHSLDEAKLVNIHKNSNPERIRRVLFLSRIDKIKGLNNLIRAWSRVAADGWILTIAGPGDQKGKYLEEILTLIRELGIENRTEYIGEIYGQAKDSLFNVSDLFVLPTLSENFGIVVAEALSYGIPVITTKAAPWSDLELLKCGWWIDAGIDPLISALNHAISLSDHERSEMGLNGVIYSKKFCWLTIVKQFNNVYREIIVDASS